MTSPIGLPSVSCLPHAQMALAESSPLFREVGTSLLLACNHVFNSARHAQFYFVSSLQ